MWLSAEGVTQLLLQVVKSSLSGLLRGGPAPIQYTADEEDDEATKEPPSPLLASIWSTMAQT